MTRELLVLTLSSRGFLPLGPEDPAGAEAPEALRGGGHHHRGLLARHPGGPHAAPGRQWVGRSERGRGPSLGGRKCFTGLSYWARLLLSVSPMLWCGVVAHAFALTAWRWPMVAGVFLPPSPLGTSSNLSCLKLFCNSFPNASQARRELSRLKEEARNKHAIAVIWAYWLGSKVLDSHILFLVPESAVGRISSLSGRTTPANGLALVHVPAAGSNTPGCGCVRAARKGP